MKKLASMLLILALVLALCGSAMAEETPVFRIGLLPRPAETEEDTSVRTEEYAEATKDSNPIFAESAAQNDFEYTYFHSLNEALMALDAEQIDLLTMDEPTVQYILSRNGAYAELYPEEEISVSYALLFLEGSAALRDSFNTAITAMQEDGTLDKLAKTYIDGVIAGAEPETVEFSSFDGADTVTVAVTGDLPPMDYVDDAGNAAGFNTAVLAEIAKRLEINIELSQIDSGARALALSSDRTDVVFWVSHNNLYGYDDAPTGTIASEPYYTAPTCSLTLKGE